MLAYGKLVSPEYNQEMMRYLVDPEINHKFVKTLNQIKPGSTMFRKSGSWSVYHADSVLVECKDGKKYILVALIESPEGSDICSNLVYTAENVLDIYQSQGVLVKAPNTATSRF